MKSRRRLDDTSANRLLLIGRRKSACYTGVYQARYLSVPLLIAGWSRSALDIRMPIGYTYHMKRTCVFLTPKQIQKLEKLAAKTGLKMSELIRRFIDAGLEKS